MVKITVFMPLYNAEKYLKKSIDSILNQTFRDFELLIVDDGSTDNSVNIINEYSDNRIRLIKNENNKGIPYTRNVGLDNAKGEYIAIMDSDDIASVDRLAKQAQYLDEHKDVGVITSSYYIMRKNINIRKVFKKNNDEFIKAYLLFDSYLCNPATMIRSSLRKFARYNEEYFVCQDFDFWVQLIDKTKFASIEEPLLMYRTGHMNITQKSNRSNQEKRNSILYKIRKNSLEMRGFILENSDIANLNLLLDFNNNNIDKIYNAIPILKRICDINNNLNIIKNEVLNDVMKILLEKQIDMCTAKIYKKLHLKNMLEKEFGNLKLSRCSILKGQVIYIIKKCMG